MRFANPLAFILVAIVIAAILIKQLADPGRRPRFAFPEVRLLREAGLVVGGFQSRLLLALRLLTLALLVVAAARPQAGHHRVEVSSEGVDIMIALDISGSMRAEDFKPKNRLNVAKEVVSAFIDGRTSDRIGLVVFAANTFVQCPLTTDYGVLKDIVAEIDFGMLEDGTAIGSALAAVLRPGGRMPQAELKVGDLAPAFDLPGSDGKAHRLSDYAGRTVVLAWFPKAFTGG